MEIERLELKKPVVSPETLFKRPITYAVCMFGNKLNGIEAGR